MIVINTEEIRIELAKLLGYRVERVDLAELGYRHRLEGWFLISPSGRDLSPSSGRKNEYEAWLDCPDWTADLETAHLLAEKSVTIHMPTNDQPYHATLPVPGKKGQEGVGETAALAVCDAALKLLRERKGKGSDGAE